MPSRSFLLLGLALIVVVYEVFLIVKNLYQEHRLEGYTTRVQQDIFLLRQDITLSQRHQDMIASNAWIDRTIKKTQDRANPGETVYIMTSSAARPTTQQPSESGEVPVITNTTTQLMSVPQKWIYYGLGVDVRE